jgi:hypothetical protein
MIASLSSVWLQNSRVIFYYKNYFVCVIANTTGYFYDRKRPEMSDCNYFACVIATIKLSVVGKPDCVYVVESYLVIWYMIASLSSVWLQQ